MRSFDEIAQRDGVTQGYVEPPVWKFQHPASSSLLPGVLTENSSSDVVMVEAAEHRQRGYVAEKLCAPKVWGVLI